jgi:glycosyltransferase involved in cell wall biosynthesis
MRIAQIAPLIESVPPRAYGGTERVVAWLTDELVRRGHDVTLFASADSQTSARLVAPYERAVRFDPMRPDPGALHAIALTMAFERAAEFDVVHCHVDWAAFPFSRLVRVPTLHTLHGRLDLPHIARVLSFFRDMPLVSISDSQRTAVAALELNWRGTVYHGLPVDRVPFDPRGGRGGYLAFFGRISPEKRPDLAIAAARRAGLPLRIAAKVDAADRAYFETEIRPLLEDPLVEFIGELDESAKWHFLGEALCLLFPIDWPEPFGLAMIEALACGTPVIARPCGSVPEVLRDGVTGYTADTVEEMADAIKRLDLVDRAGCRGHVERHFSVERMTDDYERLYRTA